MALAYRSRVSRILSRSGSSLTYSKFMRSALAIFEAVPDFLSSPIPTAVFVHDPRDSLDTSVFLTNRATYTNRAWL